MSDRELLGLAAKAAEMRIGKMRGEWCWWDGMNCFNRQDAASGASYMWNPLTDDRDAFRLSVKLRMTIDHGSDWSLAMVHPKTNEMCIQHEADADPYAATRRAIVRAAAEIGRTK